MPLRFLLKKENQQVQKPAEIWSKCNYRISENTDISTVQCKLFPADKSSDNLKRNSTNVNYIFKTQ